MSRNQQLVVVILLGVLLLGLASASDLLSRSFPSMEASSPPEEAGGDSRISVSDEVMEDAEFDSMNSSALTGVQAALPESQASQEPSEVDLLYQYSSKGVLTADDDAESVGEEDYPVEYSIDISLPRLVADSPDTETANQEIREQFASLLSMKNDASLLLEQPEAPIQYYSLLL